MTRKHTPLALALSLAAGLAIAPAIHLQGQNTDALIMVVNTSNASTLSKSDVKKMLLGQTTNWPNRSKVLVVLAKAHTPDHVMVLQKVCGMNEVDFMRYQMQLLFEGKPVTQIHEELSVAAVKDYIKANPSAVGFVHRSDLDKDLKAVLTIE